MSVSTKRRKYVKPFVKNLDAVDTEGKQVSPYEGITFTSNFNNTVAIGQS